MNAPLTPFEQHTIKTQDIDQNDMIYVFVEVLNVSKLFLERC